MILERTKARRIHMKQRRRLGGHENVPFRFPTVKAKLPGWPPTPARLDPLSPSC